MLGDYKEEVCNVKLTFFSFLVNLGGKPNCSQEVAGRRSNWQERVRLRGNLNYANYH